MNGEAHFGVGLRAKMLVERPERRFNYPISASNVQVSRKSSDRAIGGRVGVMTEAGHNPVRERALCPPGAPGLNATSYKLLRQRGGSGVDAPHRVHQRLKS